MDSDEFTLVLLTHRGVSPPLAAAFARITSGQISPDDDVSTASQLRTTILAAGLSLADAALDQFELACADAVAVFLRDKVVFESQLDYLHQLFRELLGSAEFHWVQVHVASIPNNDDGLRFARQFLNLDATGHDLQLPWQQPAMIKKARAMRAWGEKIGADVSIVDGERVP